MKGVHLRRRPERIQRIAKPPIDPHAIERRFDEESKEQRDLSYVSHSDGVAINVTDVFGQNRNYRYHRRDLATICQA